MSTQNPPHGTKVTTDPRGKENPIIESAGLVASDSLAAESSCSGGSFALNRNSEPLKVSGSNSTFANRNTSGAVKLNSALDTEARLRSEPEHRYPGSAGGQHKAFPVEDSTFGQDPNLDGEGRGGGNTKANPAPTYVCSQYVKCGSPKGKNAREEDFSDDPEKNASFKAEIGSKGDPGGLAEQTFLRANAAGTLTISGSVSTKVGTSEAESENTPFGVLGGDTPLE